VKEDWWLIEDGARLGPRAELLQELYEQKEAFFHLGQADQLLDYAKSHLGVQVSEESIETVQEDIIVTAAQPAVHPRSVFGIPPWSFDEPVDLSRVYGTANIREQLQQAAAIPFADLQRAREQLQQAAVIPTELIQSVRKQHEQAAAIPVELIQRAREQLEEEQQRRMETTEALWRQMRREREAAAALGEAFRELGRPLGSTRRKDIAPQEQPTSELDSAGDEADDDSSAGGDDVELD
jgi:hypothetical protein